MGDSEGKVESKSTDESEEDEKLFSENETDERLNSERRKSTLLENKGENSELKGERDKIGSKAKGGMENIAPPKNLSFEGDAKTNWRLWRKCFDMYLITSGGDKKEEVVKIALLVHTMGEEVVRLYDTFELTAEQRASYETVMNKFESYFVPKERTSVETYKFNQRVQGTTETFDSFVTDLKRMSARCDFGTLKDRLICDRIVQGVRDSQVKKRMLTEDMLTLDKAIMIGQSLEQMKEGLRVMTDKEDGAEINTVHQRQQNQNKGGQRDWPKQMTGQKQFDNNSSGSQRQQEGGSKSDICGKCGYKHGRRCPAFDKQCNNCEKWNHFAKMCKTKIINELRVEKEDRSNEENFCIGVKVATGKKIRTIDMKLVK